jgi:thiol-disulfide isomerase/thioredoxin
MIHVTRFTAPHCAPCKALTPEFKKLEEQFTDVKFITVDVEEKPTIAKLYEIRNVPTVIIEKDNSTVARMVGLNSKQKYIDAITNAMID